MKKLLIIGAVLYAGTQTMAQQIPLFSQYVFNQFVYNPSYTSTGNETDIYLVARRQWTGLNSAMETKFISGQAALKDGKAAIGLYFVNDLSEFTRKNTMMADYRYRIFFSGENHLSFGLAAGLWDNQFDQSKIYVLDVADPLYRLLPVRGGTAFTSNAGVSLKIGGFSGGISVPNMYQKDQDYGDNYKKKMSYGENRHVILNAQYEIVSGDWKITPFVWSKKASALLGQTDLGLIANYQEMVWASVTYRQKLAVSTHVGVRLGGQFTAAYTYDKAIGTYSKALGGSHEFTLGWRFLKKTEKPVEPEPKKEIAPVDNQKNSEQDKKIEELDERVDLLEQKQKVQENINKYQPKTSPTPAPTPKVTPKPTPAPTATPPSGSGTNETGDYILVSGAFSTNANANKAMKELTAKGLKPVYYFDHARNLHYVHLGRYASKEEATNAKDRFVAQGTDVWVKKLN
jgi:type IX secretion system PorP/SprF family membrane protein